LQGILKNAQAQNTENVGCILSTHMSEVLLPILRN